MKKNLIIIGTVLALVGPLVASAAVNFNASVNVNQSPYAAAQYSAYNNPYATSYGGGTQCSSSNLTLCSLIARIIGYLNQILFLLIGLSVVVFVYNIFKYFIKADADRAEAGKYVMYSVIGFFVILSMWGLVNILQNTFGLGYTSPTSWSSISNIFPQ